MAEQLWIRDFAEMFMLAEVSGMLYVARISTDEYTYQPVWSEQQIGEVHVSRIWALYGGN